MLEAIAQLNPWRKSIEIALVEPRDSNFACAEPLTMVEQQEGTTIAVQQLAFVKYHLEDMRKLVFREKT